jgi:hypothetical protein
LLKAVPNIRDRARPESPHSPTYSNPNFIVTRRK